MQWPFSQWSPATPDAQIPSEDGGSAKNFDASDAQTVQKVFSDLVDFITKLSDSSKDAEGKKTTYAANGSLNFHAANNTVHVNATTIETVPVAKADIRYTGFTGSATLTDNELTATINYSASFDGGATATAYKIVINDFELDELALYVGDSEVALDKEKADYIDDYYYAAVFMDAISNLQAKFENASLAIRTPDEVEINLEIKGSFGVSLMGLNLDVILNDGDGNPFSVGALTINMDLGVTVVPAGQTINGSVGLKNLNVAIEFDGEVEEKGTTTNIITFGVNYDYLSARANYADSIILNVESEVKNDRDEAFILDIITTKVEDSADSSKNSSTTTFNVDLGTRVGVGLYVEGNSIGLLADAEIDVANKTFKELDLDKNLTVTPKAALVNGKYVNPMLFYECLMGVIESMDAAE